MDKPSQSWSILYYPVLPEGQHHTTSPPSTLGCVFWSVCVFVITPHEHYQELCYVVCCYLCVTPLRIHEALGLSQLVSHHLNQVISHFCVFVCMFGVVYTHIMYIFPLLWQDERICEHAKTIPLCMCVWARILLVNNNRCGQCICKIWGAHPLHKVIL